MHNSLHGVIDDIHTKKRSKITDGWNIEATSKVFEKRSPRFIFLVHENEIVNPNNYSSQLRQAGVQEQQQQVASPLFANEWRTHHEISDLLEVFQELP